MTPHELYNKLDNAVWAFFVTMANLKLTKKNCYFALTYKRYDDFLTRACADKVARDEET